MPGPRSRSLAATRRQNVAGPTSTEHTPADLPPLPGPPPRLLKLRSSVGLIGTAVGLGVFTDLCTYTIVVPLLPFRLKELGYNENISSLNGILIAAYGLGLVLSTPPIAILGEKSNGRRGPMILALGFLMIGLVMMWHAETVVVMGVARFLQGVSATGVWTLGLSLICDTVEEDRVGSVLGWVMTGVNAGSLVGPTFGGILYQYGWPVPFIFCLCLAFIDLLLRLVIIERRHADKWLKHPSYLPSPSSSSGASERDQALGEDTTDLEGAGHIHPRPPRGSRASHDDRGSDASGTVVDESGDESEGERGSKAAKAPEKLSHAKVFLRFLSTPRTLTILLVSFVSGFTIGGPFDAGMTIFLSHHYGLSARSAGFVYIAAVVPGIITSPIVGTLSDKLGPRWVAGSAMVLIAAAFGALTIRGSLVVFILILCCLGLCDSYATPVSADLSAIVRRTPAIGYAVAFGAWNICYCGGVTVGPVIVGLMMQRMGPERGWTAVLILGGMMCFVGAVAAMVFLGGPGPPAKELVKKGKRRQQESGGDGARGRDADERRPLLSEQNRSKSRRTVQGLA